MPHARTNQHPRRTAPPFPPQSLLGSYILVDEQGEYLRLAPEGQREVIMNETSGVYFRKEKGGQVLVAAGIYAAFFMGCGGLWVFRTLKMRAIEGAGHGQGASYRRASAN